jgi:hypothetical protein
MATNTVGSTVAGYPTLTADSKWSNVARAESAPATASVSPGSLTFAPLLVGSTSAPQTATLTNVGSTALSIPAGSIVLNGLNPGDYVMAENCPLSLGPGLSCTITVRFLPTTTGVRVAQVNVNGGQATVALSGTGIAGALTLTPAALSFTSGLNVTSAAQPILVRNTGTAPVAIGTIALGGAHGGQFNRTHNCPASLGVNLTCTINVTFRPTLATPLVKNATLTVNVTAPATDAVATLTGTIIVPTFTVSPASIDFGNMSIAGGNSPARVLTITNTSLAPLVFGSFTLNGANPGQFSRTLVTCLTGGANALQPGASCTLNVFFNPATPAGVKTSNLNINVAVPATNQSVPLTGSGTLP